MGNTGDGKTMTTLNWWHRNNQRIGVAVADSPDGPWTHFNTPLIAQTPGFHDALCLANPSVTQGPDGGYLMVYKAVASRASRPSAVPSSTLSPPATARPAPFKKTPDPVFTRKVPPSPRSPFIWYGKDRYWAIVKDFSGIFTEAGTSLALFESTEHSGSRPPTCWSTLNLQWADRTTRNS